jgi:hypothetical protein
MNALLEKVYQNRSGHYVHAVEVSEVSELENIAESIYEENSEFDKETIIDFLETLSVYSLGEDNETEIYAFNFRDYINATF